jgi:hypothetical protein
MRIRLLSVLLATGLALAACGSDSSDGAKGSRGDTVSSLSADQILAKAKKAVASAEAVHIQGTGQDSGQSFDLDMTYVGDDAEGAFGIDGDHVNLVRVGGTTWFKADDAFWKAQLGSDAGKVITVINGRWIKTNGEADFDQLIAFADKDAFMTETLKPESTPTKGSTKTIDGEKCIELKDKEGSLWIALDDGRPVQLQSGASASDGLLRFSYEKADAPKAPSGSDVIDSAQFR